MLERRLLPEFSRAALAEAKADRPAAAHEGSILDLRHLLWCSIDNDDSLDLDQLSVAEAAGDGAVRVLIAIADVDATVKPGSAVDAHAQANTTSVYTAAQIFPMLPERLSTDITSLREGVDRLSIVIDLLVAPDGSVANSDICRAVVHNHAKLAYNGVAAWLDGAGPMPAAASAVPGMDEQLRIQDRVAQAMKQLRHAHGALTLETIEMHAIFDGDMLTDLRPDEKNRARELIEDFMIAANTATAQYMQRTGFGSLRRVLRTPKRWDRIVALAAGFGEHLPDEPSAAALQQFLMRRRQADPRSFPDISLTVIKLLGSGEYVLERAGGPATEHFGLAVRDYTHSTAPNRRYPDLVTQRLLKAALSGTRPPYADEELASLAAHCTTQEDNAAKVERQVRKAAAALLLASRVGEQFDAIVTGASPKGTWVRISNPFVEGRVVRGAEGLDVGDRVRVQLVSTNVERGFIDFTRLGGR